MNIFSIILFSIFVFFCMKQIYVGNHFHGEAKKMGKVLLIIGFLNELLIVAYLIYLIVIGKGIEALLSFIVAFVFYFMALKLTNSCVISRYKRILLNPEIKNNELEYIWQKYNFELDTVSTAQALIGLPITFGCIIVFIFVML